LGYVSLARVILLSPLARGGGIRFDGAGLGQHGQGLNPDRRKLINICFIWHV